MAFEAHFTRSSTMMFLLSEIIMHALATINSPAQRGEREQPDVPRRLKRIIFTVPSAMPIAEQRIYRRWVTWAVRMIWETLGWGQWYTTKQGMRDTRPDYRVSPEVRCSWDEATCTQLVYLYNEITEKFQGDARHFFALMGRKRGADAPSLRIANVDIGGGTIDLSITTFAVTGDEATAARIKPHMAFRDGFNIAGDDVIREIVEQHVLPCIGQATGLSDPRNLLGQLFGRDTVGGSQRNRALRTQFARQIAGPVVTRMLEGYEQADLLVGGVQERKLSAFFRPEHAPQESDHASPETEGLPEQPSAALIQYVNETVERQTGKPFSLMDVGLRIDPRAIDRTIPQHARPDPRQPVRGHPRLQLRPAPAHRSAFQMARDHFQFLRQAPRPGGPHHPHARFPGGKLVPLCRQPGRDHRSQDDRGGRGHPLRPVRRPSRRLFL